MHASHHASMHACKQTGAWQEGMHVPFNKGPIPSTRLPLEVAHGLHVGGGDPGCAISPAVLAHPLMRDLAQALESVAARCEGQPLWQCCGAGCLLCRLVTAPVPLVSLGGCELLTGTLAGLAPDLSPDKSMPS